MDTMQIVSLLMRWMHILSAIALMGGTIFMRFALHPALSAVEQKQQDALKTAVRRHWAKWVMATSGFLLLSGIVNIVMFSKAKEIVPPYHAVVGVKMLLALAIFFIASLLVGRSANADKFRQKAVLWMNVNLALAVVVVCIGGFLRTLHRPDAGDDRPTPPVAPAPLE